MAEDRAGSAEGSPVRRQPIEIIVRHESARSPSRSSSDDDDEFTEALEEHERAATPLTELRAGERRARFNQQQQQATRRRARESAAGELGDDGFGNGADDELEVDMDEDLTACFPSLDSAKEHAGQFVKRFWDLGWKATHFYSLPDWLQDNDYLHRHHRPPLPSFGACFKSIFSMHTETGNIWTHMLGCVAFIGVAAWFLTRPEIEVQWQEKLVFSAFFVGAIACMGMSFAFHTVHCHSPQVGKLFGKLDYVGISMLIVGSFIPWLFYGFYCRLQPKIVYIALICILGAAAVFVSLWDKFGESRFRPFRAGVFICMGLSAVIPCIHYIITDGLRSGFSQASFHYLIIMASLYIGGALLYAFRVPECFFPGKCDLWFQSHQIFHMCVIVAAFVHYHGITEMAVLRLQAGSCEEQLAKFFDG